MAHKSSGHMHDNMHGSSRHALESHVHSIAIGCHAIRYRSV